MSTLLELMRNLNPLRFLQRSRSGDTGVSAGEILTQDEQAGSAKTSSTHTGSVSPSSMDTGTEKTGAPLRGQEGADQFDELQELNEQGTHHSPIWDRGLTLQEKPTSHNPRRRHLSRAAPVGLLGLALIAVWWSWHLWVDEQHPVSVAARELGAEIGILAPEPVNDTGPIAGTIPNTTTERADASQNDESASAAAIAGTEHTESEGETGPRTSLQSLAIVNPENVPRPAPAVEQTLPEATSPDIEPPGTADLAAEAEQTHTGEEIDADTDAPAQDFDTDTADADVENPTTVQSPIEHSEPAQDPENGESEAVPDQDTTAQRTPVESFPEVGHTEPDLLAPFELQIEIPALGNHPLGEGISEERIVPAVMTQTHAHEDESTESAGSEAASDLILLPTATPVPDPARLQMQAAQLPRVEVISAQGVPFTPTPEPSPTVTPSPTPTPIPSISGRGRLWSTFTPNPAPENDHYWIGNPFGGISANRSASPSYQFGSTAGNRYRPHHGIDISNPTGTPIRAGVVGEVIHAGPDDPELLGPYNNFYGNTVVILLDQRLPVAGGELEVFVLYAHMSEVRTEVGERIEPDDIVGLVGMTGIAIGPHLHVEVRLGSNTYDHSVNPYLWLEPPANSGTVAVRVLTADGHTWAGARVSIARFEGGAAVWARQIETYLDTENIGPDPAWGENGAMGDVPAGHYYLIANIEGENIRKEFTVNAGETTFIEVRTQQ